MPFVTLQCRDSITATEYKLLRENKIRTGKWSLAQVTTWKLFKRIQWQFLTAKITRRITKKVSILTQFTLYPPESLMNHQRFLLHRIFFFKKKIWSVAKILNPALKCWVYTDEKLFSQSRAILPNSRKQLHKMPMGVLHRTGL